MTTLRQEVRACPVCEARFPISMVSSSGSFGADSDFRPRFWGPDPTEHFVQACMQCGFSGTEDDFLDGVTEGVIRKIRKFLTPRTRDLTKPSGAFYKYEFLALIYEWEDRSSREVGDGFLRASWIARGSGNREKERLYQREAVRRFEEALEVGECGTQEERAVMSYLVGDLHRRLNRRRRAETWFHRAAEEFEMLEPRIQEELGWLVDQIRRQIEAPADTFD